MNVLFQQRIFGNISLPNEVYMYEKMLYCSHVWMAPGKISCKLTGSPSLNKVFELNIGPKFTTLSSNRSGINNYQII